MTPEEIMAAAERHVKAELSPHRTITAGEVCADDLIYDTDGQWVRVVKVREWPFRPECVELETVNWTTVKHAREGIAVKRGEWS